MSCRSEQFTGGVFFKLLPLLLPYLLLFMGGIFLCLAQSMGKFLPVPSSLQNFEAYVRIFEDSSFYACFAFSLYVAFLSTITSVISGAFLAYGLWKLPAWLRQAGIIYKIPLILPHIAVGFVVLVFWSKTGILASVAHALGVIDSADSFPNILYTGNGLGMILAYALKGTSFVMLMLLALLSGFDQRQVQSARMLGASRFRIFFRIVLPRLMPGIHTSFIILFLYSFGAFDIPYLLSESQPGMLSIRVYNLFFKRDLVNRPEAMAILVLMFLFAAVFIFLYSRAVSGLSSSERKI